MNYRQQTLRNALAAEYVLGTLDGKARKRFQQLMMESQSIRETTWMWEQHLNGLGSKLAPIKPAPHVWTNIQAVLEHTPNNKVAAISNKVKRFWQSTTLLATAAAFTLAILVARLDNTPVSPTSPTQQVAIFVNEETAPLWLLDVKTNNLVIQTTTHLQIKPNNDYQLWMVAEDGRPPISLGLLPQTGSLKLPKHPLFDQIEIAALAVSLEPKGGSPTGLPTTVLFTAPLVNT